MRFKTLSLAIIQSVWPPIPGRVPEEENDRIARYPKGVVVGLWRNELQRSGQVREKLTDWEELMARTAVLSSLLGLSFPLVHSHRQVGQTRKPACSGQG